MDDKTLNATRHFADQMIYLVKRGSEDHRITALLYLREVFAENVALATEARDRRLFTQSVINPVHPLRAEEAAVDVIYKVAVADNRATPAVREAALETLRVIQKNMPPDEAVSMREVCLDAQKTRRTKRVNRFAPKLG